MGETAPTDTIELWVGDEFDWRVIGLDGLVKTNGVEDEKSETTAIRVLVDNFLNE